MASIVSDYDKPSSHIEYAKFNVRTLVRGSRVAQPYQPIWPMMSKVLALFFFQKSSDTEEILANLKLTFAKFNKMSKSSSSSGSMIFEDNIEIHTPELQNGLCVHTWWGSTTIYSTNPYIILFLERLCYEMLRQYQLDNTIDDEENYVYPVFGTDDKQGL